MYAYIRQANKKEEIIEKEKKWYSFFNPIIIWYKFKKGKVKEVTYKGNKIYILPILEGEEIKLKTIEKIKRNVDKLLEKDMIKNIVLSTYLDKIEILKNNFYRQNKNILDGRILFSAMIMESLEYISKNQGTIIEKEDLYVLINDDNNFNIDNLKLLAQKVRNLYIITNHIEKFKKLEEYLYQKLGIIINISNNRRKSLRKAKWIVNIDFTEELLEKYNINKTAIILNIEQTVKMKNKIFNGITINMFEIKIPDEIKENLKKENLETFFTNAILYESIIKKYGKLEPIREQIKKDKITIDYMIGNKGKLSKEEYARVI